MAWLLMLQDFIAVTLCTDAEFCVVAKLCLARGQ